MAYFSLTKGRPIAGISGGDFDQEILGLVTEDDNDKECCKRCSKKCKRKPCCDKCKIYYKEEYSNLGNSINLRDGKLVPLPNFDVRDITLIAGPEGSGKTYQEASLAKLWKQNFPDNDIYLFSRTDYKDDPALVSLKPIQIKIDKSLIDNPIDITKELKGGTLILFDDCNTIQDDKLKKVIIKLMADIMEVGRKLNIWIIITNHLVIPDEKKIARCVLNELHSLICFPKSGSSQQIDYVLKKYFGQKQKQVQEILDLPSRWVQINRKYPQYVIHEKGAYLLG
jgi:hypothetical protein